MRGTHCDRFHLVQTSNHGHRRDAVASRSVRPAQTLEIPQAAQASPAFDTLKATDAYLASVPADKKARSDPYFEGGYWIQL